MLVLNEGGGVERTGQFSGITPHATEGSMKWTMVVLNEGGGVEWTGQFASRDLPYRSAMQRVCAYVP